MVNAIEYFDFIASKQNTLANPFGSKPAIEAVGFLLQNTKVQTYVDLGAGKGNSILPFIALGVKKVIAVDGAPIPLSLLKQKADTARFPFELEIQQRDLNTESLQFNPSTVDCVGSFGLFNYLELPVLERIVKEISSILKPDGYLCAAMRLHDQPNKETIENLNTGMNTIFFVHSRRKFISLLSENNLSLIFETKEQKSDLFIIKKI
jgi:SAM-dependent methyltransferase